MTVPILGVAYTKVGKHYVIKDSDWYLATSQNSISKKSYITLSDCLMLSIIVKIDWYYHNEIQLIKIIYLICETKLSHYNSIGMDTKLPIEKRRSHYYSFYYIMIRSLNSISLDNLFAGYKLRDYDSLKDANRLLNDLVVKKHDHFILFLINHLNIKI